MVNPTKTKAGSYSYRCASDVVFPGEEGEIKASDATLKQLWKVHSYFDAQSFLMFKFLSGNNFSVNKKISHPYYHRLMQYNFNKFFLEEKGYKIVDELWEEESNFSVPTRESIAISLTESFSSLSQGIIFLENENEKVVIKVEERDYDDRYRYEIWHTCDFDILDEWEKYSRNHNFYKGKKINGNCDFLELDESLTWDDVILTDEVRKVISSSVDGLLEVRDILSKNGFSIKRGLILTGPYGTGKTMICKVLANEMNVSVIYVLPSHIKNVKDIGRICDMARDLSPSLLILEDIDYLAQERDDENSWSVIELMNRLDGIEKFNDVITVATTNKLEKVEKAVRNRPGRFDKVITINKPDCDLRREMLDLFTKDLELYKDVDMDLLVKKTYNMSGAYIHHLVAAAAAEAAFDKSYNEKQKLKLKKNHFDTVLEVLNDKEFSSFVEESGRRTKVGFQSQIPEDND